MKKLNITKEQFNRSRYFQRKYGKLEYVSESGKMFKTNKGKVLLFKESWNKDDYDDQPKKFRPKFDIGEKVSLTKDFYKEFYHYYNDMPEKFTKGADYLDDIPEDGWIIEDVETEDGIEGATGLHRPYYQYYITNLDMDSEYDDDSINGIWVYQSWIKPAKGSVKESTKKFGRKFNEGRLARKLNSGELFEKQMPSLGKAIQKFIDSDGRKGQAGTWNIVSDDDGSIKLYEHYGHWFGTIVDGHMKWKDEDGFYVSARYSEMILNALCDGGLIERDECQRAIEDAYAREGDYEREYGESRRFNESADQTLEDIIDKHSYPIHP